MLLTTIAFVVFFSAIFVLFTEEIQSMCKKLYSNYTLRILAPLFAASFIAVNFEDYFADFFNACRIYLYIVLNCLESMHPYTNPNLAAERIVLLCIVSVLPLLIVAILKKMKINIKAEAMRKVNLLSVSLWIISMVLTTIKF